MLLNTINGGTAAQVQAVVGPSCYKVLLKHVDPQASSFPELVVACNKICTSMDNGTVALDESGIVQVLAQYQHTLPELDELIDRYDDKVGADAVIGFQLCDSTKWKQWST